MAGMFFERHRERRDLFRPALHTAGPGRRGLMMSESPHIALRPDTCTNTTFAWEPLGRLFFVCDVNLSYSTPRCC